MELKHKNEVRKRSVIPGQYDLEFYKDYDYEKSKYYKVNSYPSENKPDFFRWIYKDKEFLSPAKYTSISRYEKVQTLKLLGKKYHVTYRHQYINYSNDDIYYEVTNKTENRLDIISVLYYNSPIYWWIIAQANNIFDVFNDIPRGTILRIPPLSIINN